MTIIKLLEEIATSAHHRVAIESLIQNQSHDVRSAFLNNDSKLLRNHFNDTAQIVANRSNVVQVTKI